MKSDEQFLAEYVANEITFDMGYGVVAYPEKTMEAIRTTLRSRTSPAAGDGYESLRGHTFDDFKLAYDFGMLREVDKVMAEFGGLRNAHRFGPDLIDAVLDKFYAPENFNRMISLVEVQSSLKNLIQQVKTGSYAKTR